MLYVPERHPVVEKQPEGWMMTRPWLTLFEQVTAILGLIITPGGIAPSDAQYLVAAVNAVLTAERLVQDTTTITWDFTTPGAAFANALLANINRRGLRAAQPLPGAVAAGTLYYVTDEKVTERSNGLIWQAYSTATATAGITEISITGDIFAGAAASLGFTGRGLFKSPADSIITLLNAAATDFARLQFGGTTALFPSLKRSTTFLQARLADDSGYAGLDAGNYSAAGTPGVDSTFMTGDGKTVTTTKGLVTAAAASAGAYSYSHALMLGGM